MVDRAFKKCCGGRYLETNNRRLKQQAALFTSSFLCRFVRLEWAVLQSYEPQRVHCKVFLGGKSFFDTLSHPEQNRVAFSSILAQPWPIVMSHKRRETTTSFWSILS